MGLLSEQARSQLGSLLESGRVRPGVTLVVVNSAFTNTFRAWLAKPGAPPKNEILLLACDEQAEKIWAEEGMAILTHVTDGTWGDLVSKRHEILSFLCQAGIDAFYSDADAFWLRDPKEYCRSLPADLAFSQGTVLPVEACRAWSFVLCTGFFYARASEQTAYFFNCVARTVEHSDQKALNQVLLSAQTNWELPSACREKLPFRGLRSEKSSDCSNICFYDEPVFGRSDALDLELCLLPHRLFARLGPVDGSTMVEHLLENKSPEWREHVAALRAPHSEG